MRRFMWGLALTVGMTTGHLKAEVTVNIDGTEYTVATLMENCTSLSGAPTAQIACFNALSELLKKQKGEAQNGTSAITDALEALRTVAQFEDDESGLSIAATDCKIHITYYNNYYHLSRRNVSTLDLFSTQFDASQLQIDKVAEIRGAQAPLLEGVMANDAKATMRGGLALESTDHDFGPKSSRISLAAYATEVDGQLPETDNQAFEFVLVHPARVDAYDDIMDAFEAYVATCQE